jgi:hypothetical protein
MAEQTFEQDRVIVSYEYFLDLLRCDVKLIRKILCLVSYYLTLKKDDNIFIETLTTNKTKLTEQMENFVNGLIENNIVLNQKLDEFPPDSFKPPVPDRVCFFASNGVFMDTHAGFQTRDVPINTVAPFKSIKQAYFMLEHMHEALWINCNLRLEQAFRLSESNKRKEVVLPSDQMEAIGKLSKTIGKYAYEQSKIYEQFVY